MNVKGSVGERDDETQQMKTVREIVGKPERLCDERREGRGDRKRRGEKRKRR